jgi:hypothetical protein
VSPRSRRGRGGGHGDQAAVVGRRARAGGAPQGGKGNGWDANGWCLSHSNGGGGEILIQIQIQMDSNYIQILSNFDHSKKDLPELKKFEIKHG